MSGERKSPQGSPNRPPNVPAEFDDSVAWAAWLYYADQLTQSEIAEILKLSRASIVKLLQEARERGVVTIRLNTEAASRTRIARALTERFGLTAVTAIPALEGTPLVRRLGDAGARVLADQIEPGDVIGVAWGRTILALARAIVPPEGVAPLTVVQVSGSSTGGSAEFSPELCSSLLASRLMARCANLLAPAVVSTPELRNRLMLEPWLVKQFQLIRAARRIVFGVGDVGPGSTVRDSELAGNDVIDAYVASGAVAAIIGLFIDAAGQPVAGDLDGRRIGITLPELKTIPARICVAGGPGKVEALRAALRGGYVTHLVTDIATGEALLAGPAD